MHFFIFVFEALPCPQTSSGRDVNNIRFYKLRGELKMIVNQKQTADAGDRSCVVVFNREHSFNTLRYAMSKQLNSSDIT